MPVQLLYCIVLLWIALLLLKPSAWQQNNRTNMVPSLYFGSILAQNPWAAT
jgi:hypothetical protein